MRHPDNPKGRVVRHDCTWPDGVNKLGRLGGACDGQRAFLTVQVGEEIVAQPKTVRDCEISVHHDFVGGGWVGQAACLHNRHIQAWRAIDGQRQDARRRTDITAGYIKHGVADCAGLDRPDAVNCGQFSSQPVWCALHSAEHLGKAVAFIISFARITKRFVHPQGCQQYRHTTGQHHRNGKSLFP